MKEKEIIPTVLDLDTVSFSTQVDGNTLQAYVIWNQGQYTGSWRAAEASDLGATLLVTSGQSISETTSVEAILINQRIDPNTVEYAIEQGKFYQLLSANRVQVNSGLKPMFCYRTQKPKVEISWYKTVRVVELSKAIDEAVLMISKAQLAISDLALLKALNLAGLDDKAKTKVFRCVNSTRN